MDQNKIETLGPTGEIIKPTDLLCFVEEKDEIRIWTNKVNAMLHDLRPKLAINNCTPTTFHYYLGTFRKLVLFLQDGRILKRMVEDDKYTDTLTDADKALVVLQKSRPSPEQDTDVPSPELGDESLRHAKVIIVDEFNHATTWWIDVLRFVYARPIYIYRSRYQYDCTVVFDYRLIQELKVAEQLETTIKGLGLNYLMATDDRFQKLGTLAAVNQSSVCIVCGHQSDKIKSRLRQQKYEETGIYMVAVPTPEISRIKAAELVGRTYSNYSDVRLWADILIRLRLVSCHVVGEPNLAYSLEEDDLLLKEASITLVPLTILRRFKDPFNRVWQAASLSQLGFLIAAVFLTTAFRVYVRDEWIIVIYIYSPLLIAIPLRYCVDIVLPYHRRNVIYAFLHEKTISGDIIVRSLDSLN